MFRHNGLGWTQEAYIKASNTGESDNFGYSIALGDEGNTLAISAYGEGSAANGIGGDQSDNSAAYAGAAYLFRHDGDVWVHNAYVKASNTDKDDLFGISMALSGDGETLAIGALLESSSSTGVDGDQADNSLDVAGAVYIY